MKKCSYLHDQLLYNQEIMQEFNLGVGSHVSITLWCKLFSFFCFFFPSPMFWAQTNCPFAWMFFFRTLATAFPTTYHMKTDCSCRVWKLSNDACPLKLVPSASFLTQRDKLEKKADQSLCIRKEALGMRLMTTRPW